MTQKKLPLLYPHVAIQAMLASGWVVAEGRDSQCLPGILAPKDPLVAIECLAQEMSRTTPEVFAEAVEPSEIPALSWCIPAGNQHPLLAVRMKIKTGESGMGGIGGFGSDQEFLSGSRFPWIFQMTVSPGALVAKAAGEYAVSLFHQAHTIDLGHTIGIGRFSPAIPDAEDDPAFFRAVDLHAEVTSVPAAGHVVGVDGILNGREFSVEGFHLGFLGYRVKQVDRCGIASGLQIEMVVIFLQSCEIEGLDD